MWSPRCTTVAMTGDEPTAQPMAVTGEFKSTIGTGDSSVATYRGRVCREQGYGGVGRLPELGFSRENLTHSVPDLIKGVA